MPSAKWRRFRGSAPVGRAEDAAVAKISRLARRAQAGGTLARPVDAAARELLRGFAMEHAKPILVVYATREGQTRKIAHHVAATIQSRGDAVDVVDAAHPPPDLDPSRYCGAVLLASVHLGSHEREMKDFVRSHVAVLDRMPTALLSVSMSEAAAEDRAAPFDVRAKAAEEVKRVVDAFCRDTGLHPSRVRPIAGALMYSRYGALTRLVMRMIAKREHTSTDTSRDHEYTDWQALDRFVAELAEEIERPALFGSR